MEQDKTAVNKIILMQHKRNLNISLVQNKKRRILYRYMLFAGLGSA